MRHPLATLLPLFAAVIYALAAMMLKRAGERGVGPWRVTFVTNWVLFLVFAPWWLTGGAPFTWMNALHAFLAGLAFFVGQIFTFLALNRGDVSVATPVLGTKVLFVAFFAFLMTGEHLSAGIWVAALLTAIATALLGGGQLKRGRAFGLSIVYGFCAASSFALTDVLQQRWVRLWGFGHFAPAMFLVVAFLSFFLIPFFSGKLSQLSGETWRWLLGGSVLLGLQATCMAYSIATFREVTTTNILYNSRGIWSVALVWIVGHWFENDERAQGRGVMLRRLGGAALLLGAIVLAVHH